MISAILNLLTKITLVYILLTGTALAQTLEKGGTKKTPIPKGNKCTTWVANLSNSELHTKGICFNVTMVSHQDLHELESWRPRKKTDEFWRFSIKIEDSKGGIVQQSEAAYYLYEETSELRQYHCLIDEIAFKAVVFDKQRNCWEIILMQNDQWKILSPYPGYHFIEAFGIKTKESSSFDY